MLLPPLPPQARDCYRNKDDWSSKLSVPKYLLETRQGVAIKRILAMCEARFGPGFKYKDGKSRSFRVDETFVRRLRPWNVVASFGKRETSLCRYHMQWDFIAAAIWAWQKKLHGVHKKQFQNFQMVPSDAFELRRKLVCKPDMPLRCPRPGVDTSAYDNIRCRDEKCENCRDLRLLVGHDEEGHVGLLTAEELEYSASVQVTWQKWTKGDNGRWDFVATTTGLDGILEELRTTLDHIKHKPTLWRHFKRHHDLMKWMNDNKAQTRSSFPRGQVHCIQDFSENGTFTVRLEHQSRYYETHSYTLLGMVVDSHLDDRVDIGNEEKTRLRDAIDLKNGHTDGPWIVTDMHIGISEDTVHDPAAVMHYNDNILIPKLKEQIPGLLKIRYITDGAPTQFDNKDMYYWISLCFKKHGVYADWVIGCAAHNKDLSDGECGACKHCIDGVNLTYDRMNQECVVIDTAEKAKDHLQEHFQPEKTVDKKGGKGIRRRFFYFVPLKVINRRLPTIAPVKGSKVLHQFLDVGKPGKILVRHRPCYKCDGCAAGNWEDILKCQFNDICGKARWAHLRSPAGGKVQRPVAVLTTAGAHEAGRAAVAESAVGDFLVVELNPYKDKGDDGKDVTVVPSLPWMVGEIVHLPNSDDTAKTARRGGGV